MDADEDAGGERSAFEKVAHDVDDEVEVGRFQGKVLKADEAEEVFEEAFEANAFDADAVDFFQGALVSEIGRAAEVLGEEVEVEPHGGKRVANLMRQAARELGDFGRARRSSARSPLATVSGSACKVAVASSMVSSFQRRPPRGSREKQNGKGRGSPREALGRFGFRHRRIGSMPRRSAATSVAIAVAAALTRRSAVAAAIAAIRRTAAIGRTAAVGRTAAIAGGRLRRGHRVGQAALEQARPCARAERGSDR